MKKMKQSVALILSLLLFLSICFTSCKSNNAPDPGSISGDATTVDGNGNPTPADEKVLISDKGTLNFKVVIPEGIDSEVSEVVNKLVAAIQKRAGVRNVPAVLSNMQEYDANAYEILIGNTGYAESNQVYDTLGYGDWTVRFCGKKLVVAGFSKYAISDALTELISYMKEYASNDKTIAFPANLNKTVTSVEVLNSLPHFASGKYPTAMDEGQDTGLAVMPGMTADDYGAFLNTITGSGFTLRTSNQIQENKFSTYENATHLIHAAYYPSESAVRATIEVKTNTVPLEGENVYSAVPGIVTTLAQIGLGESESGGMSYCYQLADGSFIVVDGGYERDAVTLYNYMKAKAPDGKIVIAAWFLTHNDNDHVKGFSTFCRTYANEVKLEQVVANFASFTTYFNDMGVSVGGETTLAAASDIQGCKIVKAHTGYKFFIRNAVAEILYTTDNLLPEPASNGNVLSMVFTVNVEGERTIFLGDATDVVAKILVSDYGSYLKSDILQLAHHGKRNYTGMNMANTESLYRLIRPEIVLWPTSNVNYLAEGDETEVVSKHPWNLVALESARECYLAGEGITVLELPYAVFSAYKFDPAAPHTPVCAETPSSGDSLQYLPVVGDTLIDQVDW